jgi:hypothetical protein
MYHEDMTVEPDLPTLAYKFLSYWVTISPDRRHIGTTLYLPNHQSIKSTGRQHIYRFPNFNSASSRETKCAIVNSMLLQASRHGSCNQNRIKGIQGLLAEFQSINYPPSLLRTCLRKLVNRLKITIPQFRAILASLPLRQGRHAA